MHTDYPPHRAHSPHSRRPASIRAIDRNGHMDSTCTSRPPRQARSPHSRHPANLRTIDRNDHMDNNRLPRLPAPSADTRMSVRAANLATRSRGSLKPTTCPRARAEHTNGHELDHALEHVESLPGFPSSHRRQGFRIRSPARALYPPD